MALLRLRYSLKVRTLGGIHWFNHLCLRFKDDESIIHSQPLIKVTKQFEIIPPVYSSSSLSSLALLVEVRIDSKFCIEFSEIDGNDAGLTDTFVYLKVKFFINSYYF